MGWMVASVEATLFKLPETRSATTIVRWTLGVLFSDARVIFRYYGTRATVSHARRSL